jgi:hypothetical protein
VHVYSVFGSRRTGSLKSRTEKLRLACNYKSGFCVRFSFSKGKIVVKLTLPNDAVMVELPSSLGFTKKVADLLTPAIGLGNKYGIYIQIQETGEWVNVSSVAQKAVICDYEGKFGGSILANAPGRSYADRVTTDPGGSLIIYSTVDDLGELWLGAVEQRRAIMLLIPILTEANPDLEAIGKALGDPEKGIIYNGVRSYVNVVNGKIVETPIETAERAGSQRTGIVLAGQEKEVIFGGTTNNANIVTITYVVSSLARHLPFTMLRRKGNILVPNKSALKRNRQAQLAEEIKSVKFMRWFEWTTQGRVSDFITTGGWFTYMSLLRKEGRLLTICR